MIFYICGPAIPRSRYISWPGGVEGDLV